MALLFSFFSCYCCSINRYLITQKIKTSHSSAFLSVGCRLLTVDSARRYLEGFFFRLLCFLVAYFFLRFSLFHLHTYYLLTFSSFIISAPSDFCCAACHVVTCILASLLAILFISLSSNLYLILELPRYGTCISIITEVYYLSFPCSVSYTGRESPCRLLEPCPNLPNKRRCDAQNDNIYPKKGKKPWGDRTRRNKTIKIKNENKNKAAR